MTTSHPTNDAFSSDLIELPADPMAFLASRRRKNVIAFVLVAVGVFLFMIGGATGLHIGGCLVVVAIVILREHYYLATFDLVRQQVTLVSITLLTTHQRVLPFDAIRRLDFKPGQRGVALWLRDGSMVTIAGVPDNYAVLDRCMAEIRTRVGLAAARVGLPPADVYSNALSDPAGLVTITSSSHHVIGNTIGGLLTLLITAAASAGWVFILWTEPPDGLFSFLFALVVFPTLAFVSLFGVCMLFRARTKLLLDPAKRQLHVERGFVKLKREETIAFEDVARAGVIHNQDFREGSSFTPYLILKSDRLIRLDGLGDDFRCSDGITEVIRKMTGAERRNIG